MQSLRESMRITEVKINNYRAFYGEHNLTLDKDGKNLMLYGENGSGKSSLFTALKDFFLSSSQKLKEVEENIFAPVAHKNTGKIEVTLKENGSSSKSIVFELNSIQKEIVSADKIIISDANKIKGFFDYRNLLRTHLNHKEQVDLFDIVVSEVLYHSINRFSNKEIGKEWETIHKDTYEKYQTSYVKETTINYIKDKFNPGLKEILLSIEKDTNTFIKYFGINVDVSLVFNGLEYHGRKDIKGNVIELKTKFFTKDIPKHQYFLNEARLTALAISLYLASIKVNPTKGALKLLVLDDLLIGLDMSNRLPLLEILKNHFVEVKPDDRFQVIMTTYDKVWYELVKNYFGVSQWKFIEVYSKRLENGGFEMPVIKYDNGYLDKAKKYLGEKDFKASAVYIRTEFEKIAKKVCEDKSLTVRYKQNQKELKSDDFWHSITTQTDIDVALVKEIEIHRGVVMNPYSHHDLEKPEYEKELTDTIASIEKLIAQIVTVKKTKTIDKLEKEVSDLTDTLTAKEKLIHELGSKLKTPTS